MERNTAAPELRHPWLIVAGSLLGLIVANGPVTLFTYGLLLQPVTQEFGWQTANFGFAILLAHVSAAATTPFVGHLVDRYGIRRVCLPFITLFAISFAAIGLTPASPVVFILLYMLTGVFSAGQTVMPYAKAVSAAFDMRRGLALGLALAGVGIGTSLAPNVTHYLIDSYGWRGAYFGLGALTFALAFPAVAIFVGRADQRLAAQGERGSAPLLPGVSGREARCTFRFWAIAIAGFLVAVAVNGAIPHVVQILTAHGIPRGEAASIQGWAGLAAIAGRILAGLLLDRIFATYVALAFFALPLFGLVLLGSGAEGDLALFAVIALGLGLGAEIDTMGFMIGRYFGLRRFGEIYGYSFAMFALGSGFGPLLWDLTFDATGSYDFAIRASVVGLVVAGLLVLRLGAYSFPAQRAHR